MRERDSQRSKVYRSEVDFKDGSVGSGKEFGDIHEVRKYVRKVCKSSYVRKHFRHFIGKEAYDTLKIRFRENRVRFRAPRRETGKRKGNPEALRRWREQRKRLAADQEKTNE